ncbi:hypothetical protein F503_08347 [Ophiostoma piceae UAMH 11346]|uniref:Uncharacterized protein n=1 Tax=Ophiostoma piceae (strain UAMH 11346) TaxID=1262450 RepID=S3C265_OPHP1|nr:hypothetical protein F503_08347 [Ophiostoma piceae UAMH 11346]
MDKFPSNDASSTDTLLPESPPIPMPASANAGTSGFHLRQRWQRWWQGWQGRPLDHALERLICMHQGKRPEEVLEEVSCKLLDAASMASNTAFDAAYGAKQRGSYGDRMYAETTAALAMSVGLACRAVCRDYTDERLRRSHWSCTLQIYADTALLSAEAAYAAANARLTRTWPQTLASWISPRPHMRFRVPDEQAGVDLTVDTVIAATIACAAFAHVTADTASARPPEAPTVLDDIARIESASSIAHAAATAAGAAATAARATHPTLALRADHAAAIAITAAAKATTQRFKILQEWYAVVESFKSDKPLPDPSQPRFDVNEPYEYEAARFAAISSQSATDWLHLYKGLLCSDECRFHN